MKRAKKRARKPARKYVNVNLTLPRAQLSALAQVAEFADKTVEDVMTVLIGVAMYMGRCTTIAVTEAPQVPPEGAPAPAPTAAPSTESQP